jgi:hypothetical protein
MGEPIQSGETDLVRLCSVVWVNGRLVPKYQVMSTEHAGTNVVNLAEYRRRREAER